MVFTPTGLYFFTTEFLTAGDLKSMMGESIEVLEKLFLQALRALEYLRANKLLHLDIKPQNLLLRHDGGNPELAVIDFGLATFRPPDKPGGTANYMPPEMVVRRLEIGDASPFQESNVPTEEEKCPLFPPPPDNNVIPEKEKRPLFPNVPTEEEKRPLFPPPDHRSDLYSLGVTFYYCLTGIHPFAVTNADGKLDALATLKHHLDHDPPPPSTYRKEIPPYLDRIIMKLMARHMEDRYPSAIVAAQALGYRSPNKHASESKATLLAYLPREGKLIGRHKEREIIEQTIKDVAAGKPHIAPIVLIAGPRGVGRTRLLRAIKPFAQQMELDVRMGDASLFQEPYFFSKEEKVGDASLFQEPYFFSKEEKRPLLFLIDDIDEHIQNGTGHANLEAIHTIIRKLKLQQKLKDAPGPKAALIMTLNTDRMDEKRATIELGLDEHISHTIALNNFTSEEVAEYLTAVLGERPDNTVICELKRCTDGSPQVITEHLEEMIAKGRLFSLAGRPDAKTLKTIGINFSNAQPPKSLSKIVEEKLSHLPKEAADIALFMACAGKPVSAGELKISPLPLPQRQHLRGLRERVRERGADISHSLLMLTTADIISHRPQDGKFEFANPLIAKIILGLAPPRKRAQCHDEIAKQLSLSPRGRGLGRGGHPPSSAKGGSASGGSSLPSREEELIYHIAYGTDAKKAIPALKQIAANTLAAHEPMAAAEHLNYLLSILPPKNISARAEALELLGHAFEKARMPDDAKKTYEKMGQLEHPLSPRPKDNIHGARGRGLGRGGHPPSSAKGGSASGGSSLPSREGGLIRLLSLEHLGRLEMRRRNLTAARKYFEQALNTLSPLPRPKDNIYGARGERARERVTAKTNDLRGARLLHHLRLENFIAGVDLRNGKIEQALATFKRTAKLAKEKLKSSEQEQITNNELGEALLRSGDVKSALKVLEENLAHLSKTKTKENIERFATDHYIIGNALQHSNSGDHKKALEHYQKALEKARAAHLTELEVRILNGIGNLYNFKFSDPAKAMEHYKEAIGLAQQLESETTSIELMIGMGLAAQKMHNSGSTIEYLEAALDFTSGPKGTFAGLVRRYAPTIYVSLGDAYYQIHDLAHAEKFLESAIALDKKHRLDPEIRYSLYGTYAEVLLEKNDIASASHFLSILKECAEKFPPAKNHFKELSQKIAIRQMP